MIILLDIGNTNTHLGLANARLVVRHANIPTTAWFNLKATKLAEKFSGPSRPEGAVLCSVVPQATQQAVQAVKRLWNLPCLELTSKTIRGVGIQYPKPESI